MIRPAQRALTAGRAILTPQVKTGYRPKAGSSRADRQGWHGQPAVSVDLLASNGGGRTFETPDQLLRLARELEEAAEWLTTELMFGEQDGDQTPDTELPGMWETSDFTGGLDEVRP